MEKHNDTCPGVFTLLNLVFLAGLLSFHYLIQ